MARCVRGSMKVFKKSHSLFVVIFGRYCCFFLIFIFYLGCSSTSNSNISAEDKFNKSKKVENSSALSVKSDDTESSSLKEKPLDPKIIELNKLADAKKMAEDAKFKKFEKSLLDDYNLILKRYSNFKTNFSIDEFSGEILECTNFALVNIYDISVFDESMLSLDEELSSSDSVRFINQFKSRYSSRNDESENISNQLKIIHVIKLSKPDKTIGFIGNGHGGTLLGYVSDSGDTFEFLNEIPLPIYTISNDSKKVGVSDGSGPLFYIIDSEGSVMSGDYTKIAGDHFSSYGKVLPIGPNNSYLIENLITRIVSSGNVTAKMIGSNFQLDSDSNVVGHFIGSNELAITSIKTGKILYRAKYSEYQNLFSNDGKYYLINKEKNKIFEYEIR